MKMRKRVSLVVIITIMLFALIAGGSSVLPNESNLPTEVLEEYVDLPCDYDTGCIEEIIDFAEGEYIPPLEEVGTVLESDYVDSSNNTLPLEGIELLNAEPDCNDAPVVTDWYPGCDMTPYLQKVITVMGENLYVISVDKDDPSKAFCMLVYPDWETDYLPKLNPVGDSFFSQEADNMPYQQVYGYYGSSETRYEDSYGDQVANTWASQSKLYPYLWEETIGVGDTYKKTMQQLETHSFDELFLVEETPYTSTLKRRAYLMSVSEARDIDFYNWIGYDWVGNEDVREHFWLRTTWNEPTDVAIPARDENGNDITVTQSQQQYAVCLDPNNTWISVDEYKNHANDAIYQKGSLTEKFKPAIVCNVYNLSEDMITINYELMPDVYKHRIYIDCRNVDGEHVGITFSLGKNDQKLDITEAGECTCTDGFFYVMFEQNQREPLDYYRLRVHRVAGDYVCGVGEVDIGCGGNVKVMAERVADVWAGHSLSSEEMVTVTNPYYIHRAG